MLYHLPTRLALKELPIESRCQLTQSGANLRFVEGCKTQEYAFRIGATSTYIGLAP